jgi:hypothetical protein
MFRVVEYTTRFQGARTGFGGLPSWARAVVLLAALPGLVLIALSILAFLVSVLALLLLAVPAYRLMKLLTGSRQEATAQGGVIVEQGNIYDSPGRKRVEATVIDPVPVVPEGSRPTTE